MIGRKNIRSIILFFLVVILTTGPAFAIKQSTLTKRFIQLNALNGSGLNLFINKNDINHDLSEGDFDLRIFFDGRSLMKEKLFPQNIKVEIYTFEGGQRKLFSILNRTVKNQKASRNVLLITKIPRIEKDMDLMFDIFDTQGTLTATYSQPIAVTNSQVVALESAPTFDCNADDGECLIEYILRHVSFSANFDRHLKTEIHKNDKGRYFVNIPVKRARRLKKRVRKFNVDDLDGTGGNGGSVTSNPSFEYPFFNNSNNTLVQTGRLYYDENEEAIKFNFTEQGDLFSFGDAGEFTLGNQLNFTSKTLNTVPQEGAFEYDGTGLYFTIGGTRVNLFSAALSGGDNLGNHIADMDLNMNGHSILGADQVNGNIANFNNINTGDITITNGASAGFVLTSDAAGNASWQSITGDNLGNHIAEMDLNMNGFNLVNANILYANGAVLSDSFALLNGATAGFVLTSDANGNATWQAATGGANGDNLGNHNADMDLNMNGFNLVNANILYANGAILSDSFTFSNGASTGFVLTSDANGVATWQDLTTLASNGDNLGNHLATQGLEMAGFTINNADQVNGNTANFTDINSQNTTINGSLIYRNGATAGFILVSDANGAASWTSAASISVNGDNLGNHIATQALDMNGFNLVNANILYANGAVLSDSFTFSNGASTGFVLTSDANGVATWQDLTTLASNGDNLGNHTATQVLDMAGFTINNADQVNGNTANFTNANILGGRAFFNGGSLAQFNGQILIPNGATNGFVLASDANGFATWTSAAALSGNGDNLGNHTATQLLDMAGFTINNTDQVNGNTANFTNGNITNLVSETGLFNGSFTYVNGASNGFVLVSDANGLSSWTDPTTIPGLGGDNLGNHLATQGLEMAGFTINNADQVNGNTANFTDANILGGRAFFNGGSLAQFNGQILIPNGATNGFVLASDANGYATWTSAAALSGNGDNLGNHTATQALAMAGFTIANADQVNGNTANFTDFNLRNGTAFFNGGSLAQFNGTINIPNGASAGFVLTSNATGDASWQAAPTGVDTNGNVFVENNDVISNNGSSADYQDDFVLGSPSLDYSGNSNHSSRLFFSKSSAAFRAGLDSNGNWDAANLGIYSAAFGNGTIANGIASFAYGQSTSGSSINAASTADFAGGLATGNSTIIASGGGSTARGATLLGSVIRSQAVGSYAGGIAGFGGQIIANGSGSFAYGSSTGLLRANGVSSFAFGDTSVVNGDLALSFGTNNIAEGQYSLAFGNVAVANGDHSVAIGEFLSAVGSNSIVIGSAVQGDTTGASVIGIGNTNIDRLNNATANSLAIGFNSNATTLFVGPSAGTNTTGNIGIATTSPAAKLDIIGDIKITDGTESNGFVLTSDANGLASWQPATGGSGDLNGNVFVVNNDVISNNGSDADYQDDFVIGSPSLDDDTDSNHDDRLFFDKSKGALRAGRVTAGNWDDAEIGNQSTAFGINTIANGVAAMAWGGTTVASATGATAWGAASDATNTYATAWGDDTTANGVSSTAWGRDNIASGRHATAWGWVSWALGEESTAWGEFTIASNGNATAWGNRSVASGTNSTAFGSVAIANGLNSVAFGEDIVANGSNSIAIGQGNSGLDRLLNNQSSSLAVGFNSNATTFFVGPSAGTNTTGNIGIATTSPAAKLDIIGDIKITDGTEANGFVLTSDANGLASWQPATGGSGDVNGNVFVVNNDVISNNGSDADYQDDFVLGSPSLDDTGIAANDARVFFDKSQGAFRAGRVSSTEWDSTQLGLDSVAFGAENLANGTYSSAFGFDNVSTNTASFASGFQTQARGFAATSFGVGNVAAGASSIAWGQNSTTIGFQTTAWGFNSVANGNISTAFGNFVRTHGDTSIAFGDALVANGDNSIVIGLGADAGAGRLANEQGDSLIIGFDSNIATLFVGTSSGLGTTGNVGIATTSPAAKLDIIGDIKITDGTEANGFVLTSDANGLASWTDPTTIPGLGGDNLGNHLATQGLEMAGFTINNADQVNGNTANFTDANILGGRAFFNGGSLAQFNGQILIPNGATNGFVLASDANGFATWTSAASLSGNGDNLGNHTATQALAMAGFTIANADQVNGNTANFTDANILGGRAFFNGGSLAQFNGQVLIPAGAANGLVLTSDANGYASWQAASGSGVDTNGNVFVVNNDVISNNGSSSDYQDDFIIGSPSLDDTGDVNHDNRLFFDKSKGAFRAGGTTGNDWDDALVGDYSMAFGLLNRANGDYSAAWGVGTRSVLDGDTSFGFLSQARGGYATAWGRTSLANGNFATAWGWQAQALGFLSTAFGQNTEASGNGSLAWGDVATANGHFSTAAGTDIISNGDYSFAFGRGNDFTDKLVNNQGNSLTIGFNSNAATFYVGPSAGTNTTGNIGIATTSPAAKLDIIGDIKITDGTEANGFVLTSDANGLASWQPAAGGSASSGVAGAIQFSDGSGGFDSNGVNFFWDESNGFALIGNGANNVTAIGQDAAANTADPDIVAIGDNAARNTRGQFGLGYVDAIGSRAAMNNIGYGVIAIGWDTGMNNNGNNTTLVGANTGINNVGAFSTHIGAAAGRDSNGINSTSLGYNALRNNVSNNSVGIGIGAGVSNTGSYANLIGTSAGADNNGSYTNFIGERAGQINSGTGSIGIGTMALQHANGDYNVAIGNHADRFLNNGSENIAIGFNASVLDPDGDKQINIGNTLYGGNGSLVLGRVAGSSTATLEVNGSFLYTDGSETNGFVLTSDANGLASWQPAGTGSEWTDTGSLVHPSETTDDVAIGGSTIASPIFFDASAGSVTFTAQAVTDTVITARAASGQTANLTEWQNGGGLVQARVTSDGSFSNNGGELNAEIYGDGANTNRESSVAIGNNATISTSAGRPVVIGASASATGVDVGVVIGYSASAPNGGRNIAIGDSATANGTDAVALGTQATATSSSTAIGRLATTSGNANIAIGNATNTFGGNNSVAIGAGATANGFEIVALGANSTNSGFRSTAVGYGATSAYQASIVLGMNAEATATNQFVVGSETEAVSDFYLGEGVFSNTPSDVSIQTSDANGTDTSAGSLTIAAGRPTGSGTGGDIVFSTANGGPAGTDLRDLHERVRITETGTTIINGALQYLDGNQAAGFVLTSDATGNATWQAASGGGDTNGQVFIVNGDIISNNGSSADYQDDFVVGSSSLDDTGSTSHDNRMFFDKSSGSFRAGSTTATDWDSGNRGDYSTAFGLDTLASGQGSFSYGTATGASVISATGDGAFAGGSALTLIAGGIQATGDGSFAVGTVFSGAPAPSFINATNSGAFAGGIAGVGSGVESTGAASFAFGHGSGGTIQAMGNGSFALGTAALGGINSNGTGSFALGSKIRASADYAFTIGTGTSGGAANDLVNTQGDSLVIGFDSNLPTVYVGAANGFGTTGNVGIATTSPAAKLDIIGDIKITDGTESNGFVLTSDANGLASWQPAGGGSSVGAAGTMQFSDGSGGFNGDETDFYFDDVSNQLVINTANTNIPVLNVNGFALIGDSTNDVIAIGNRAANNLGSSGTTVYAIGNQAGQSSNGTNINAYGNAAARNASSSYLNAMGYQAGMYSRMNYVNAFGFSSGRSNNGQYLNALNLQAAQYNNGDNVNAFGANAARYNNGDALNAIGPGAAQNNLGNDVNAIGNATAYDNVGNYVNAFGWQALRTNNGDHVVGIGYRAGYTNKGDGTIAIGRDALIGSNGDYNIAIGYLAGEDIEDGARNILIGYDVEAPDGNENDQLNIGDTIYGSLDNGEVAIGRATNNPNATLEVNGSFMYTDSNETNGYVLTSDANGLASWQPASGSGSVGAAGAVQFSDGAGGFNGDDTNFVYNSTNGSLGIGTSTPVRKLSVIVADSTTEPIVMAIGSASMVNTENVTLLFDDSGTRDASITMERVATAQKDLLFETSTSGSPVERMRVTGTGDVGIGTDRPDSMLHVRGSAIGGDVTISHNAADAALYMRRTDGSISGNNTLGTIYFTADDGATNAIGASIQGQADGSWSTGIYSSNLVFSTSSTNGENLEKMRLDSNGNLSIGLTTAAARLDVNGTTMSDTYVNTGLITKTPAGAVTIDWNEGNYQSITLNAATTFTFTNPTNGIGRFVLLVYQDATGSRTATWPAGVLWPGGSAPVLSTVPNSYDIVTCIYNGTNYACQITLDFR